jgi:hypothetical protein
MGSACGPGASPTPDLRESARDVPRTQGTRNKNNQNHARGEIIDFFFRNHRGLRLFFIGPISQHKHKQYEVRTSMYIWPATLRAYVAREPS